MNRPKKTSDRPALPEIVVDPAAGLRTDAIALVFGVDLVPFVGPLTDALARLRAAMANDMGVLLPPVRLRDDPDRSADEYAILLHGTEIAVGRVAPDSRLAFRADGAPPEFDGARVTDPVCGHPAVWLAPDAADDASRRGLTVVAPGEVMRAHLEKVLRRRAADWFTTQDAHTLLDRMTEYAQAAVMEVEDRWPTGSIRAVFQRLLRRRGHLRGLPIVLEAMLDSAAPEPAPFDADALADAVLDCLAARTRPETR